MSGLSDYDINKLKIDLEILAKKHNLNFDDLQDPEKVKQILTNTNESLKSWLADNWYYLVDKISKYGNIFAAVNFVGHRDIFKFSNIFHFHKFKYSNN